MATRHTNSNLHTPEKWKGVGLFLNFGSEYSHTPTIHQIEINSSAGIVF